MVTLVVNGKQVNGKETRKLMDFLREDLRITSVKNGCNQGACGACNVIVDGKVVRACMQPLTNFANKSILTVEGFSEQKEISPAMLVTLLHWWFLEKGWHIPLGNTLS